MRFLPLNFALVTKLSFWSRPPPGRPSWNSFPVQQPGRGYPVFPDPIRTIWLWNGGSTTQSFHDRATGSWKNVSDILFGERRGRVGSLPEVSQDAETEQNRTIHIHLKTKQNHFTKQNHCSNKTRKQTKQNSIAQRCTHFTLQHDNTLCSGRQARC